jgi:hypothetical protein
VKVMNWWALASTRMSDGAAQTKPTFHPVRLKILPAEPIFMVRSRMPGSEITGVWRRPSKMTCSQTSSQSATASWRTQNSASRLRSWSAKAVAVGLSGLLKRATLVLGEKARASASSVRRKAGGCSVTKRGTPPARRTSGR